MIEFKFEGLEDLKRDLKRLGFADQQVALTRAARAGAEIIRKKIADRAPRDTGKLSESIIMSGAGQKNDLNSVTILIGPSTMAFYGFFQEYGTAFQSAQPFLEPAFEEGRNEAMAKIAEELSKQIEKRLR